MKKIVSIIAAISLILSAPAFAHERREHHERGNDDVAAAIIGAIILGTIISNSRDDDREERDDGLRYRDRYEYRYRQAEPTYCWRERVVDYYGRTFYKTVCSN